ncbi:hypothetical protein GE061_004761 [Apolygus lucorum]|uniref:Reverse transcriptase domain-containing protein n=1 Tax=Apolygus lucorum TaxID=248454 RepID=A0A8S9X038_APOLU|nr:hypothetical protein GE061_004761 [Apolygus lucorum]
MQPRSIRKVNLQLLKTPTVAQSAADQMNGAVRSLQVSDIEMAWADFKAAVNDATRDNLSSVPQGKQMWMNSEILHLMEQRRLVKKNSDAYKALQVRIRSSVRHAREEWISAQCEEIELLSEMHDDFNLHKKVRDFTSIGKKNHPSVVVGEDGKMATTQEEKCRVWEKYVEELFQDARQLCDLAWIASYLTARQLSVRVNGVVSRSFVATSGVPQGSHLGFLLFNLVINGVISSLQSIKYLICADDLKLFVAIGDPSVCLLLQQNLDALSIWCDQNGTVCLPKTTTRDTLEYLNQVWTKYNDELDSLLSVGLESEQFDKKDNTII